MAAGRGPEQLATQSATSTIPATIASSAARFTLSSRREVRALWGMNRRRALTGANRGLRSRGAVLAAGQAGFVIVATTIVTVLGNAGIWPLERDQPNPSSRSYGAARWWASTITPTINGES